MRRGVKLHSCRRSLPDDRGTTVMEVLVTVLLLSALGMAILSAYASADKAVRRALRDFDELARLASLDSTLRRAALRVLTPFWLTGPEVETAMASLQVAWVDGEPAERLVLERKGAMLVIHLRSGSPQNFGPFSQIDFGVYPDAQGRSAGLQVSVVPAEWSGDPMVINAPFGGAPMLRRGGS